jgi:hypothetical protein
MREPMNSSEPKSLELSLQVYRRLLAVYPAGFLGQFGDQLAQNFGDLARRAMRRGGVLHLLLLWMRILPDLGSSAIREHLNVTTWTAPARLRLRWVMSCSLGCGFGFLSGFWADELISSYQPYAHSFLFMLVLGIFQSMPGLKLPRGVAVCWTLATIIGNFLIAVPARPLLYGYWSLNGVIAAWFLMLLQGLGIGLCQFVVLRRASPKAWYWIPANAFGVVIADVAIYLIVISRGPYPDLSYVLPFVTGGLFGVLTAIPLGTILRPTDAAPAEGAVQS